MQTSETNQKQCEQCRALFTPQRSTARFCSTSCRAKAHNQKTQADPTPNQENAIEDSPNDNSAGTNVDIAEGEQSSPNATEKAHVEFSDIAYRFVTTGTPGLCGFCDGALDLDGDGVALVDGPVMVAWPMGKTICRSCAGKDAREAFAVYRAKEDEAEKAIIAQRIEDHRAPFLSLRQTFGGEEFDSQRDATCYQPQGLIDVAHKAARLHPDFIKACARIGLTSSAHSQAIIEARRVAKSVSIPPRKGSPAEIENANKEAQERVDAASKAIDAALEIHRAALPQALEVYAQVFEGLAGVPLPKYQPSRRFAPMPGDKATLRPEIQLPTGEWVYYPAGTGHEVQPPEPTPLQLLAFYRGDHDEK